MRFESRLQAAKPQGSRLKAGLKTNYKTRPGNRNSVIGNGAIGV
jgi:hypothetical protein